MNSTVLTIVYMVFIFGIFFLIIILPEKKRKKKYSELIKNLKVNDDIITRGGIVGKVVNMQEDFVVIQSGPDKAKIKLLKSAVSEVINNQTVLKK